MCSLSSELPNQVLVSASRQVDVAPRRLSRLLRERVKNEHARLELRNHQHAMLSVSVDSDLHDPSAHGCHRLPVAGFAAMLDEVQLPTGLMPSRLREATQVL
jgi:hypothetical protein